MTKLTKSQRAARFDAFCQNDSNFVVVAFDSPEAIAIRAKQANNHARREAAQAKINAAVAEVATSFKIGDTVKTPNLLPVARGYREGTVTKIDGTMVHLDTAKGNIAMMADRLVLA